MNKYKKILSLMLAIFFAMLPMQSFVKAQTASPNTYNYKWKDNSIVIGSNSIEKTFYVPQNMNHNNFIISLKIKQSPTLVKDLSSVSILVNNTQVHSAMMSEVDVNGMITVGVPNDLIHKGENSISIRGFLKSTREKCELNDEINWVVIEKGSYFGFNFTREESSSVGNIFDGTYYSNGLDGEVYLAFPDNLTKENYSQMASISALTGFIHKNKEVNVEIKPIKYSEVNAIDKETIIVGTSTQVKAWNKDILAEEDWKGIEENGGILLRKIGLKNHFIAIVSNEAQLELLCKTLQNKSILNQVSGAGYVLSDSKVTNEKEFNTNPTLNALGYEDVTQMGNGIKKFNYYFSIPMKKTLTKDNKLSFNYNYSSLVDFDNAYVNVSINGENLLTKNLNKDALQSKLEFSIPERYFEYSGFNVSLEFNLRPNQERCSSKSHEDAWVTIDSMNSKMKLDLKDREKYSLINSGGLFQNDNGYVDGSIVADSYKNLTASSICNISLTLGKTSQGVSKLILSEASKDKAKHGGIISLTTSPIIKDINSSLRIPVSESGRFENKDLFIQNTPSLGSIQLTSNGESIVFIASDSKQLISTVNAYSKTSSFDDTVILKDGKIIESFGKAEKLQESVLDKTNKNYTVIIASGVVLIATAVIYILYRKKIK